MSAEDPDLGANAAAQAREELYSTLSQLRVQLNYAQRIDDSVDRAKARLVREKENNPAGFAIAVAGVAAVVGLAVWGVSRIVVHKFRR